MVTEKGLMVNQVSEAEERRAGLLMAPPALFALLFLETVKISLAYCSSYNLNKIETGANKPLV